MTKSSFYLIHGCGTIWNITSHFTYFNIGSNNVTIVKSIFTFPVFRKSLYHIFHNYLCFFCLVYLFMHYFCFLSKYLKYNPSNTAVLLNLFWCERSTIMDIKVYICVGNQACRYVRLFSLFILIWQVVFW